MPPSWAWRMTPWLNALSWQAQSYKLRPQWPSALLFRNPESKAAEKSSDF